MSQDRADVLPITDMSRDGSAASPASFLDLPIIPGILPSPSSLLPSPQSRGCGGSSNGGAPTLTTPTLTPTTLRNIHQMFAECDPHEPHPNAAGFVPPIVSPTSGAASLPLGLRNSQQPAAAPTDPLSGSSVGDDVISNRLAEPLKIKAEPESSDTSQALDLVKQRNGKHSSLPPTIPSLAVTSSAPDSSRPRSISISSSSNGPINGTIGPVDTGRSSPTSGPSLNRDKGGGTSSSSGTRAGPSLPPRSLARPQTLPLMIPQLSRPKTLALPSLMPIPASPVSSVAAKITATTAAGTAGSNAVPAFPGFTTSGGLVLSPSLSFVASSPLSSLVPTLSLIPSPLFSPGGGVAPGSTVDGGLPAKNIEFLDKFLKAAAASSPLLNTPVVSSAIFNISPSKADNCESSWRSSSPTSPPSTYSENIAASSAGFPHEQASVGSSRSSSPPAYRHLPLLKTDGNGAASEANSRLPAARTRLNSGQDDTSRVPEDLKKAVRRERNKQAAARCRKRRMDLINNLQDEVDEWESKVRGLKEELIQLESQKKGLEGVLHRHRGPCRVKIVPAGGGGRPHAIQKSEEA